MQPISKINQATQKCEDQVRLVDTISLRLNWWWGSRQNGTNLQYIHTPSNARM